MVSRKKSHSMKRSRYAWLAIVSRALTGNIINAVNSIPVQHSPSIYKISGGQYERNPDMSLHSFSPNRIVTLGDLERQQQQPNHNPIPNAIPASRPAVQYRGSVPLRERIVIFFTSLHRTSPTLNATILSSLFLFILWQFAYLIPFLSRHCTCSMANIRSGRVHSIFLSTVSHTSLHHLLLNLYMLYSLGIGMMTKLRGNALYPFIIGSSLVGSLFFLALTKGGSCIGLSGVTCAMLGFECRWDPMREFRLGVLIPLKIDAGMLLLGLLVVSALGALARGGDGVAHATHLGGLVFGVGYYEYLWGEGMRFGRWSRWMWKRRSR